MRLIIIYISLGQWYLPKSKYNIKQVQMILLHVHYPTFYLNWPPDCSSSLWGSAHQVSLSSGMEGNNSHLRVPLYPQRFYGIGPWVGNYIPSCFVFLVAGWGMGDVVTHPCHWISSESGNAFLWNVANKLKDRPSGRQKKACGNITSVGRGDDYTNTNGRGYNVGHNDVNDNKENNKMLIVMNH